jgi:hypothetical protein
LIEEAPLNTSAQDDTRSCLRSIAVLLAIPAIFLLIFTLWTVNLKMTIFSPSFLKRIPAHHGIYERLPEIIIGIMTDQTFQDQEDMQDFKETIGQEPLEKFVTTLLPLTWIQGQVENNIDIFFSWLEGEIPYPNLHFTYSDIVERAQSEEVRNAMRNLFSNLPPCESERDFYWQDYPRCRPPENILETLIDDSLLELQEIFPVEPSNQEIPTQELDPSLFIDFDIVPLGYRIFNTVMWTLWGITLLIWLNVIFMATNTLDGILTWIGWPILVVGMLTVSIVLILLIVSPSQIHDWFAEASQNPTNNPYTLNLLSSLTMAFIQDVLERWLFLSGMFSLLGGGSLVLALWLRRLKGL